jgi:hypothetical protein
VPASAPTAPALATLYHAGTNGTIAWELGGASPLTSPIYSIDKLLAKATGGRVAGRNPWSNSYASGYNCMTIDGILLQFPDHFVDAAATLMSPTAENLLCHTRFFNAFAAASSGGGSRQRRRVPVVASTAAGAAGGPSSAPPPPPPRPSAAAAAAAGSVDVPAGAHFPTDKPVEGDLVTGAGAYASVSVSAF